MDIFGNLEDWGKVLKMLENLKDKKKLDEHQRGLARILNKVWAELETS